jgi:hypothetical protein
MASAKIATPKLNGSNRMSMMAWWRILRKCIGDTLDTTGSPYSGRIVRSDMNLVSPLTGEDKSQGLFVEEKECINIVGLSHVAMLITIVAFSRLGRFKAVKGRLQ